MSSFNTSKVDGNLVGADEWNQLADYNTLQTSSGQTPSISNTNQGSIAAARYASAGSYFLDTGTANSYVLNSVSPFKAPVDSTLTYFVGMIIRFRAGNANTGASTVNVNSAGIKNLKKEDGTTDLDINDISPIQDSVFRYNGTAFCLINKSSYQLKSIQIFTASGTWTKPAGCRAVEVKLVGGGGSGGNSTSGGTGGGGGGYSEKFITSGLGATETITVGAGGTAAANGNNGNTGGTTSFGTHCSATGGGAGKTSNATGVGDGGFGSGGNINIRGGSGGVSISTTLGGTGGASVLSNTIGGAVGTNAGAGFEYGGGSGGANGGTGGTGAAGIVIVYEYY